MLVLKEAAIFKEEQLDADRAISSSWVAKTQFSQRTGRRAVHRNHSGFKDIPAAVKHSRDRP